MFSKIGWLDCFCAWAELESAEIFVSEMIESIRKYGTPNIHTQGLYRNLKCSKKTVTPEESQTAVNFIYVRANVIICFISKSEQQG